MKDRDEGGHSVTALPAGGAVTEAPGPGGALGALRVLVVAHYASDHISGESSIPLHVFRRLRAVGVETWLLTHDSFRAELAGLAEQEPGRVLFCPGLPGGTALVRWGERQSDGPRSVAWAVTQVERQIAMWPRIRRLVRRLGITVVHQPVGVAPSVPSFVAGVGAPVVIGPLNGGMSLPPAFALRERRLGRALRALRRPATRVGDRIAPGRRRARVVLVANERTRALLPPGLRGEVRVLSEIGVVTADRPYVPRRGDARRLRAVFVGRLVDWKAVDLLVRAVGAVPGDVEVDLEIVGDGPERSALEELVRREGLAGRVTFSGWLGPEATEAAVRRSDALVLTSLREAGGAVLLEAMATGRPVVACAWGGPAELVPPEAGVLVTPTAPEGLVADTASALRALALDPDCRVAMGAAGRRHVEEHFDWEVLTRGLLDAYARAAGATTAAPTMQGRPSTQGRSRS